MSRRERRRGYDGSQGKEKFLEEREEKARLNEIKPMNKKQAGYLAALQDPDINVIVATGLAGCVDADTEYLTETGWVKISNYHEDKVAQVDQDLRVSFVKPEEYIKVPTTKLYHFKGTDVDQVLSDNHNIVGIDTMGILFKRKVEDSLKSQITIPTFKGFTDYKPLGLTIDQIRLAARVLFKGYTKEGYKHRYLLDDNELLLRLGIEHTVKHMGRPVYEFDAEFIPLGFEEWMFCTPAEANIILEEFLDLGSLVVDLSDADALQLIFASTGYHTSVFREVHPFVLDEFHKTYGDQDIVRYRLVPSKTNPTLPIPIEVKGEYQYCFTVPTGMLLLRRNGKIFVTGNSSKTYIPTAHACLELLRNRVYKVAFSRPAISNSKSLGYFSGPQPLSSLVLTPEGFVTMGSIEVGDKVLTPEGKVTKVVATTHHPEQKILEFTTIHGQRALCSESHLWKVSEDGENYELKQAHEIPLPCYLPPVTLVDFGVVYEPVLITDILEHSYQECKCITLEDPEGMYVTNDYIPTHNSKDEKMSIWLAPVLNTVKQFLGSAATEIAIKNEDIVFYPLEVIKGLSLGSTSKHLYFIVDEAEDLSIDEVKKIITRIGKNCTLVLAGDITQSELKASSGLKWLVDFYERHELKGFYHVDFDDVNDIVRSDVVKNFIVALKRDEK